MLVAGPTGLEQKDPSSNKVLATYFYKDIDALAEVVGEVAREQRC